MLQVSAVDTLGPNHLIEISQFLWMFLGTVITDDLHLRREALSGGEEGNGLELWRVLFWEHEGGDSAVQIQGMRAFHNIPKCKDVRDLNVHIGEWLLSRSRYASTMPDVHVREFFSLTFCLTRFVQLCYAGKICLT